MHAGTHIRSRIKFNPRTKHKVFNYHQDDLKTLLETFRTKPDLLALTETWMTEDEDRETYNLKDHQHIESNLRKHFDHVVSLFTSNQVLTVKYKTTIPTLNALF